MERHMKFFLIVVASTILGTWFATDVAKQSVNEETVNESYMGLMYQGKFGDLVTFLATLGYVHQAPDVDEARYRMKLLVSLHLAKVVMMFGPPHVAAVARDIFNGAVLAFIQLYGADALYDYAEAGFNIVNEVVAMVTDRILDRVIDLVGN